MNAKIQGARVDLYTAAHKGVRLLVAQTAKEIQTGDFTSPAEMDRVVDAVGVALDFMAQHARAEDTVIQAALREREPELVADLEKEHRELDALADAVRAAAAAVRETKDDASGAALTTLDRAYCRWWGRHLAHMAREEETSLPALWKHFDDGQLVALRREIQAGMAPERLVEWMRWFFRGMNAPEVGDMLAAAKASAPPGVFAQMARLAEDELGPRWESAKRRAGL